MGQRLVGEEVYAVDSDGAVEASDRPKGPATKTFDVGPPLLGITLILVLAIVGLFASSVADASLSRETPSHSAPPTNSVPDGGSRTPVGGSSRGVREEYPPSEQRDYPVYDEGPSYDDAPEPCVGDCTDMDHDGRTSDDVDADGDGLYESW